MSPIDKKYAELGGEKGFLGKPETTELTCPDGVGRYRHYQRGSIYWHPSTGAYEVHGSIRQKWSQLGWEKSFLGYPATDETMTPDGEGRFNHFQHGSIYWHPGTGAYEVHGSIRQKWSQLGWEKSFIGYPLTDELPTPDMIGRFNHFQGGSIHWHPQFGACEVHGLIRDKWAQLGWETGFLGYPMTDCLIPPDKIGRFTHFQGGSIYWWPQIGAFEVHGAIRDKWAALGWETKDSALGYPTSDETPTADGLGRFNNFQRGAIYWHPQTGAQTLLDLPGKKWQVLKKWRELGAEKGVLGYPTSGETSPDGGLNWYQYFQRGSLHWQSTPEAPLDFAVRLIEPVQVMRPEDLLALTFELSNLKLVPSAPGKPPSLVKAAPNEPAFIIVHFPPQNIAERAFYEASPEFKDLTGEEKLVPPPIATRLSGPSHLVFEVPLDVQSIGDFTLANLLQCCTAYPSSLAPSALPPPGLNRSNAKLRTSLSEIFSGAKKDEPIASLSQAIRYSRAKTWGKRSTVARSALSRAGDKLLVVEMANVDLVIPGKYPNLQPPTLTTTAIEAPYRLILSPSRYGVWLHASTPVTSAQSGRTELWHTRLATRIKGVIDETDRDLSTVRAIWARSEERFNTNHKLISASSSPFRMSLDPVERHNLVHLSSNFNIKTPKAQFEYYTPLPIAVEQLMLSPLGAWLNLRGAWEPMAVELSVSEWRHRGTMGRDHYVRVVNEGFLFPFCHRAALITVTERKFHADFPGNPAYLRQRNYIVVREPLKVYGHPDLKTPEGHSYDRQFPFTSIRLTTLVTPDLDPPKNSDYQDLNKKDLEKYLFWPMVGNALFRFHLVAEDVEGQEIEFTAPLIFANNTQAQQSKLIETVKNDYEKTQKAEAWKAGANVISLHGQSLAFAENDRPGDANFEVESLTFGAEVSDSISKILGQYHPPFYPAVRSAKVFIPALTHLAGDKQAYAYEIKFYGDYLMNGFTTPNKNKGQVFAEPSGVKPKLDFSQKGNATGALLKPSMNISGLSRSLGPVAGNLKTIGDGTFNPEEYFGPILDAKLFGVFELSKVVKEVDISDFDAVPKFVSETLTAAQSFAYALQAFAGYLNDLKKLGGAIASDLEKDINKISDALLKANLAGITEDDLKNFNTHLGALAKALPAATVIGDARKNDIQKKLNHLQALLAKPGVLRKELNSFLNGIETAKEQTIRFEWKPKLQSWFPPKAEEPLFQVDENTATTIAVEKRLKTDGKIAPEMNVFCSLENFTLQLLPPVSTFFKIHFEKLQFIAGPGKKPDVNVVLKGIEFAGPLCFLDRLRSLIPLNGFSDPPSLNVDQNGITAGYSMALPNLAIGVFSIQNLSMTAGFKIPFIEGALSFNFRFCKRHAPFLVTVSALGGGGYFGLDLTPDGVQLLEGAIEFGGNISVDFGVASGCVYVMAGIYIKWEKDKNEVVPSGYFRMGGAVEVLGLICVSIEQRVELRYENDKFIGRGSITVEIDIAFFEETVEISYERKFAGSAGDPTFAQIMGPETGDPAYFPWREYCQAFA